jgi:hypothetical protein
MPHPQSPEAELAWIRTEIRRLKTREAVLRAEVQDGAQDGEEALRRWLFALRDRFDAAAFFGGDMDGDRASQVTTLEARAEPTADGTGRSWRVAPEPARRAG